MKAIIYKQPCAIEEPASLVDAQAIATAPGSLSAAEAAALPPAPTAESSKAAAFRSINRGYNTVFRSGRMSIGLVAPIENYASGPVPSMHRHLERVKLAEELGYAAVWLRDVPFNVPSFGDAGQTFDPFAYLGYLAGQTQTIALGVASVVLPLRHPAHVAKAAATADVLSGGRLILGVASGDRPQEYPALNLCFDDRGARFRESLNYIRSVAGPRAQFQSSYGSPGGGMDLLPKPAGDRLPLLITGGSQQDLGWIAGHGDGWMIYPRHPSAQAQVIEAWRNQLHEVQAPAKPVMQPLYLDLLEDPDAPPEPIHLGLRVGVNGLHEYLGVLHDAGVNHVALNLRFNTMDTEAAMRIVAERILPDFRKED